jgi:3D (Asp-Asp-Asp) domain-containing protein
MPDKEGIGPRGVVWQGTGKAESGEYITIDHMKTDIYNDLVSDYYFTYGEGGAYARSVPWKTVGASNPNLRGGDKVVIEIYPDIIFTVTDRGTELGENHLDVFVGEMTIAEADALGRPHSRVGRVVEP